MGATGEYERVSIDLDLVAASPPPAQPHRPRWSRSRRRVAIAAAVVAAASVLAADTVDPAGGAQRPVTLSAVGTPLAVIDDSLYTRTDGGSRLNAYSLRTGRRRWSTALPKLGQPKPDLPRLDLPSLRKVGSHLLLTSGLSYFTDASRGLTSLVEAQAVAVEARTGAVRWQRPGELVWVAPAGDRVALQTHAPAADPDGTGGIAVTAVTVVAVGNGAEPAVVRQVTGGRLTSTVVSADRGQVTGVFQRDDADGGQVFDFATGGARRLALPLPASPFNDRPGAPNYESLLTAGDMVLQTVQWRERSLLTAYAGDPPRVRWSVPDLAFSFGWRCGAALCRSGRADEVAALDPATGEVRWRSDGNILWPATGHRVFSSSQTRTDRSTGIAVLDEAAGRELLRQEAWRPVALIEGEKLPVLAYSPDGEVLAILDARRLTAHRLALFPTDHAAECWTSATNVTCRIGSDTFRAWRYSS